MTHDNFGLGRKQVCVYCGLSFQPAEGRALHPDGTMSHEPTLPDSMRRCRGELMRQRDTFQGGARNMTNIERARHWLTGVVSTRFDDRAASLAALFDEVERRSGEALRGEVVRLEDAIRAVQSDRGASHLSTKTIAAIDVALNGRAGAPGGEPVVADASPPLRPLAKETR